MVISSDVILIHMKKLTEKLVLLFIFIVSASQILVAQPPPEAGPGRINGKVCDAATKSPLEFATISVYKKDSSLVTGTITSADGSFSVDVKPGNYYISVQFISYKKQNIENILITPRDRIFNTGIIDLYPVSENLEEVTVVGEKSEMVFNLDKKVFNVGKDLSNTGKSALDILDNIPSVTVDLDGNVSLRGSDNLKILIDGKPSGLANAGNTDALQNLPGNMIERVEVITNPSARYEAEGMTGIINIVLKKDQQKGVNGSFELTGGYPANYSAGTNMNFRRDKINYFINYNLRYRERPGGGNSYQAFTLPDTSYITLRDQDRNRTGLSNRVRAGADYFITPSTTLTAALMFAYDDQENNSSIRYTDYAFTDGLSFRDRETPETPSYITNREEIEQEYQRDMEFSLNFEKKFKKEEHKLTALAQYINDSETEDSRITETVESFTEPSPGSIDSPDQRVLNKERETNLLLQADYIYPFGNKGKFEAGYRSEFRNINNPYSVDVENETGGWDRLTQYSNHFEYVENIHALYLQAGNNFGKFALQAGLRAELSDVSTYLHETDSTNERRYLDFFPTLHTSFQLSKAHSAQLSYSRRIHRPHFWFLNPFYSYTDPRNFRSGNPNLNPEYTHSLELGYLLKKDMVDFYSGVYYRYTTNVMERINQVDEETGITVVAPQNLDHGQSYGFEVNATLNPVKWWTLSGDLNFYRFMVNGDYNDQSFSSDDYSWNTRLNSKMRLPKSTDIQFIFFYRAPQATTQGNRETFYMLNAAISKDVLKGKGTLTFNVRDVLNSMRFRFILDQEDLYSYNDFHRSQRRYTLTFLYRLNQQKRMGGKGMRPNGNEGDNNGGDYGGDDMGF